MRRSLVVAALALAGLAIAVLAAYAAWSSMALGSGNARASSLPAGNVPTVSASGSDVTVSWTQVTFAGSTLGAHTEGGYLVTRYADGSSVPIGPGPYCAGRISGAAVTLSCTENAVPDGTWRYSVTPVLANWRGVESGSSDPATVVDATPPISSITFPVESGTYGAGGWMAGCGTPGADDICGTASDAGSGVQSVEVSIRLGTGYYWGGSAFDSASEVWFPALGTTSWSYDFASTNFLTDGQYTTRSRATDSAGNVQPTPAAVTFTIDKTSPSIARVAVADATGNTAGFLRQGGDYFVYAEVTDAGSGVASVSANVGNLTMGATSAAMTAGGPWTIGGQTYNHRSAQQTANAALPESGNPYSFTVGATDAVGNTSSLGGSANVDNTQPLTVASLNPVPNGAGWNNADVTVTLTASDGTGSGPASITYSASGAQTIGSTTVAASSTSFVISTEGITTISFHATDNVGNVESPDNTQVMRLDKTNPSIARTVIAESANDTPGYMKASGTYFVYAQASDALSGVATVTGQVNNLSTGGGNVAMTTTGGPWTVGGLSYNYRSALLTARSTLVESGNPYSFSVRATDTASNTASLNGTVNVDGTQPATSSALSPPANGAGWNNANVTVTLTGSDAGSGVRSITYSASGAQTIGSTAIIGSSASFVISSEGTTTISFHATDNVGNVESPDKTQVVKLDKTNPAIARTALADATTSTPGYVRASGTYFVYAQASDGLSGIASVTGNVGDLTTGATAVAMTTTGGPWTVGGQSYNYRSAVQTANGSLSETGNPYTFAVTATDTAGNNDSLGGAADVDNTEPSTSASLDPAPDGSGWNTSNVTVTLNATDSASGVRSITYSASGAQTIAPTTVIGSSASFTISTDGTTTISFHATDNVGNVESPDKTQVVKLDKNGPTIARVVVADSANNTAGYVTQGGGYFVYAQVTDPGSGVATVTADVSSLTSGATSVAMTTTDGPWTIGGQSYNYRSDQQPADNPLPETGNPYPFTVGATDTLGMSSSLAGTAAVDNTGPAIARVVVADATNSTAGYFREGGGYYVYAQVTDGAGVAAVTADVASISTGETSVAMTTTGGPWTLGGLSYNYRSAQQTANAVAPELGNPYAFTVNATDNLANASSLGGSATVDNTPPTISRVAVANTTNNATVIRQGGTYFVYAEVSNGGSGVRAVTANVGNLTTGATSVAMTTTGGPWTIDGQTSNYRTAQQTANASLPESGNPYAFTVTATDKVGNASAPFGGTVNVDNTAPTASDVQATNDSLGTAGRAEQNDRITFTFSQQMDPNTIKAGWDGSATTVTVKLDRTSTNAAVLLTVWGPGGTTQLGLGSVNLKQAGYLVGSSDRHAVFSSSSMVQSGATITITLGTASGDAAGTAAASSTMTWTPSTAAKDLAGNAMAATNANESGGVLDLEF